MYRNLRTTTTSRSWPPGEERRIWIDWEENTIGKRAAAQMIITRTLVHRPDNNYLVFSSDGTMVG